MSNYEKPKRGEPLDNEYYLILKDFYWRLFCYLMTPALFLAFIFVVPIILVNQVPDRLNAQCAVYSANYGIRIISETRHVMTNTYYWTNNRGTTWHIIYTEQHPYQRANADCSIVSFDNSNTIQIHNRDTIINVSTNGAIMP